MNLKTRKMYEKMYDILYKKFFDRNRALDTLVEFIAVDNCPSLLNQLNHKFEWLSEDKELCEDLLKVYDLSLLKADTYDYLGELYVEKQAYLGQKLKEQSINPDSVTVLISSMAIRKTDGRLNILDPCVGTGRFLLAAYKYAPNANFFGVDTDLRALRIALTNCAIHNIPAYLLHADSQIHEIDISKPDGLYNWQYANRWYSCIDKLRKISQERTQQIETQAEKECPKMV